MKNTLYIDDYGRAKDFIFYDENNERCIDFNKFCILHGKTYKEKQDALSERVVDYYDIMRYIDDFCKPSGLYWGELYEFQVFFEKNARRYGMLDELRNDACVI